MTAIMHGMIVGFWAAVAVVTITAVRLMSCHFGDGGLDSCGTLPNLVFLLGTLAVTGTVPFFLISLTDRLPGRSANEENAG